MNSEAAVGAGRLCLVAVVVGCVGVAGCLSSDRATSTGTVTFDGRPVETGSIVFLPPDRAAAAEGALITAGRYTIAGRPGPRRVEIRGTRPVPAERLPRTMPRLSNETVYEDYVPAAYNTETTLQVEVVAGNGNVFDFDLKPPERSR